MRCWIWILLMLRNWLKTRFEMQRKECPIVIFWLIMAGSKSMVSGCTSMTICRFRITLKFKRECVFLLIKLKKNKLRISFLTPAICTRILDQWVLYCHFQCWVFSTDFLRKLDTLLISYFSLMVRQAVWKRRFLKFCLRNFQTTSTVIHQGESIRIPLHPLSEELSKVGEIQLR